MNRNDKLFYIVVVYNQPLVENSSILNINDTNQMLIVDNSIDEIIKEKNKVFSESNQMIYLDMEGNQGISKAYNCAIKYIKNKHNSFWIMTLDQDTVVSKEYLNNIHQAIKDIPEIKIKTGIIKFKSGIGSPKSYNNKSIKVPGIYKDLICINSCLVLHSDIVRKINGYDERLFLDMVDYLLFHQINLNEHEEIEVVAGDIYQNFSGEEYDDYSKTMARYNLFKKDFKTYCILTHKSFFYKYKILIKRRANIIRKYKRII